MFDAIRIVSPTRFQGRYSLKSPVKVHNVAYFLSQVKRQMNENEKRKDKY